MKAYLDSGATTVVSETVVEVMNQIYLNLYGNPSSMHRMGVEAELALKGSKKVLAKMISADYEEIIFTSGGTESNNLAILGVLNHSTNRKKHIITSVIEHPSVLNVYNKLESRGYDVSYIKVDANGFIDLKMLEAELRDDTALVSIMYVNNELGTIQDIQKISKIIRTNSKALFHVDAVQALGKLPCHVKKLGVDLMTFSAHKIHGPMGVGALYVKKGISIEPFFYGGSQQKGIRPGTENLPGIVGFSKACEEALNNFEVNQNHLQTLKSFFITSLNTIPHSKINGDLEGANHIVNVSFPNMRGEVLLHMLESKEVYVSTGSACASKNKSYSHVLEAIGLDDSHKEGAIRFSFSKYTTLEVLTYAVEVLKECIVSLDAIIKGR